MNIEKPQPTLVKFRTGRRNILVPETSEDSPLCEVPSRGVPMQPPIAVCSVPDKLQLELSRKLTSMQYAVLQQMKCRTFNKAFITYS